MDNCGLRLAAPVGSTSPGVATSVVFGNAKVYFEVSFPRTQQKIAILKLRLRIDLVQAIITKAEGKVRVGVCQSTTDVQKLQPSGALEEAGAGGRDAQTAWTVSVGGNDGDDIQFPPEGVGEGGLRVGVAYAILLPHMQPHVRLSGVNRIFIVVPFAIYGGARFDGDSFPTKLAFYTETGGSSPIKTLTHMKGDMRAVASVEAGAVSSHKLSPISFLFSKPK